MCQRLLGFTVKFGVEKPMKNVNDVKFMNEQETSPRATIGMCKNNNLISHGELKCVALGWCFYLNYRRYHKSS